MGVKNDLLSPYMGIVAVFGLPDKLSARSLCLFSINLIMLFVYLLIMISICHDFVPHSYSQ